jgi:hypothetical protein
MKGVLHLRRNFLWPVGQPKTEGGLILKIKSLCCLQDSVLGQERMKVVTGTGLMKVLWGSLVIGLIILGTPSGGTAQYESLVSQVAPAVVLIHVTKPGIGAGTGTGFFVDPRGYILTARHVIEGADVITVRTSIGEEVPATVIDYSSQDSLSSPGTDAAVLKVEGMEFPALRIGDSSLIRPGQEVLAFGYPLVGLGGSIGSVTVTRGIVSAIRPEDGLIQIDATINPGNSGGPLLTLSGYVIGIVTARLTYGPALGLAVPVNAIRNLTTPPWPSTARPVPAAPPSEYPLTGRWAAVFQVMGLRNKKTGHPCCPLSQYPQQVTIITLSQSGTTFDGTAGANILHGTFDADSRRLAGTIGAGTFTGVLADRNTLRGSFDGMPAGRYHFYAPGLLGIIGAVGVEVTAYGEWQAQRQP